MGNILTAWHFYSSSDIMVTNFTRDCHVASGCGCRIREL